MNVIPAAQWLDQQRPGWHNKVDIARLDMHSTRNCVLAQLFGPFDGYMRGSGLLMQQGRHDELAVAFCSNLDRDAWIREIERRRTPVWLVADEVPPRTPIYETSKHCVPRRRRFGRRTTVPVAEELCNA